MNVFPGVPEFNAIDYFVVIFLLSLLLFPLSLVSRRRSIQNAVHICLGMLCLFSVAPRLLLFYVAFWIIIYLLTIVAGLKGSGPVAVAKVAVPIVVILAPMVYWKLDHMSFEYLLNFGLHSIIWSTWRPAGEVDAVYRLVAPLGLSFSAFRAVDLIIQVHIGILKRPRFGDVMAYGLFAPVQVVGPIIQFGEINRGLGDREQRRVLARWGLLQIVLGIAKALVLSWPIAWSAGVLAEFANQKLWVVWLATATFPVYLFLNFSGFTDISIGIAALFGHRLDPNFNHPLLRPSLQQFWNNWHMSLTRFAQRNVFVPLGGYRPNTQYFALFCTMMVIAFWHDLSIPLAIFGALHGSALVVSRVRANRRIRPAGDRNIAKVQMDRRRVAISWAVTYLFIMLTFPLLVLHHGDVPRFYETLVGLRE